jgi:branched-chain amino acid transport system substrate-binding protein
MVGLMRNAWWIGLATVVLAVAAPAHAADPGNEIRIGLSIPLTGVFSSQAPLQRPAILLAEKQINQAGGINGKKVRIVMEDNQSTNPGALTALNKNVEQNRVLAVVGPMMSTQILAMTDAIKQFAIPAMIGGTNITITKQGNPWVFRCRARDSIAAAAMVKYIKDDLKLTKIGVLHSAEAFGNGGADLVEQYAKEQGLRVVARERFTLGDHDFTSQLLAIKSAGAEVMIPYSAAEDALARIAVLYRQLGSPYKYLGVPGSAMRATINLSGAASEGLLAFVDAVPGMNEANRKYVEAFRQEYGTEADMQAAFTYDAVNLLAVAIRKAGEDRAKIREALLAIHGYEGVLGTFNFTPEGEGLHGGAIAVIKDGKAQAVKVISVN